MAASPCGCMRNTGARHDCLGRRVPGGAGTPASLRAQPPEAPRCPSVPIRSVPFSSDLFPAWPRAHHTSG
eukprot:1228613-Prymnesium_polylepis.1